MAPTAFSPNDGAPRAIAPSFQPIELSFLLPRSAHTHIHLHLSYLPGGRTLLLFLTTASAAAAAPTAPLGSFVYAIPDRRHTSEVFATGLYAQESTVDLTTRLARLLARKLQMPVYVGCSASFASAGLGGTMEEEMEGVKRCLDVVLETVQRERVRNQDG
ncbi:MAG: hypothetical protein M1826_005885 [Phylliscum demangeonii]|nr:MAG: hypothetical protein M1826_005885 [Phylliscum demangeonii]